MLPPRRRHSPSEADPPQGSRAHRLRRQRVLPSSLLNFALFLLLVLTIVDYFEASIVFSLLLVVVKLILRKMVEKRA